MVFSQTWTSFEEVHSVTHISIDNKGNKWLGRNRGITLYDNADFINFDTICGIANPSIHSIYTDKDNNKWFGVYQFLNDTNAIVFQYNDTVWTYYEMSETGSGLGHNAVNTIYQDEDSNIWFGTYSGLVMLDGEQQSYFYTSDGLADNWVKSIISYDHRLWVGTNSGLSVFDGTNWETYTTENTDGGLIDDRILELSTDEKGNLWVGTPVGLSLFDGVEWTNLTEKNIALEYAFINEILTLDDGGVWLATPNGYITYDGENWEKHHFSGYQTVYSASIDVDGSIWFSTYDFIVQYKSEPLLFEVSQESISLDTEQDTLEFVIVTSNSKWTASIQDLWSCSCSPWLTTTLSTGLENDTIWIQTTGNGAVRQYAEIVITEFGTLTEKRIQINEDLSVSNVYVEKPLIQIYPNPVIEILTIRSSEIIYTIDIFSVQGLKMDSYITDDNIVKVDFSNYTNGVYYVRIYYQDSVIERKIIKN